MPNKKRKQVKNYVGLVQEDSAYDKKHLTEMDNPNANMTNVVLRRVASEDEAKFLRSALKTADLRTVPLIIGAAILNRLDLVNDLIHRGVDVNDPDQHKTTSLIWAVKYKHLECAKVLLEAGADITVKSCSGDHLLFTALDSKLWDEKSFIFLWKLLNEVAVVNCNLLNKSGNSMIHIAVRREWFSFLDILMESGVYIDIANYNGVTPLMLASFRNNLQMIDTFLKRGADVERQDSNGFLPLCYAFSSAITKYIQPPNLTVNRLLQELEKRNFSMEDYIQKRMEMILNVVDLQQLHNGQPISTKLLHVLTYIIRYTRDGVKVLLNTNVFRKLKKVSWKCIGHLDRLKIMLILMHEILTCGEFSPQPKVHEQDLCQTFEVSGSMDLCFEVLRIYENSKPYGWVLPFSFRILMQVALVQKNKPHDWVRTNLSELRHFWGVIRGMELYKLHDEVAAQRHSCKSVFQNMIISQENLANFKDLLDDLSWGTRSPVISVSTTNTCEGKEREARSSTKSNSKKSKRRTKALKATIAKIKSADLTERLNLNAKKILLQKNSEVTPTSLLEVKTHQPKVEMPLEAPSEPPIEKEDCTIVNSIKRNLLFGDELDPEIFGEYLESRMLFPKPDWKSQILSLPFDSKQLYINDEILSSFKWDDLKIFTCSKNAIILDVKEENVDEIITPAVKYLHILVDKIIDKYRKYWEIDRELEKQRRRVVIGDKISSNNSEQDTILEQLEMEKINLLLEEFNSVMVYVRETAIEDMTQCRNLLKSVERVLLSHKIRGSAIAGTICPMETISISATIPQNFDGSNASNSEKTLFTYMEDVLSNRRNPIDEIKITVTEPKRKYTDKAYVSDDVLYMEEMKPIPKAKEVNPKVKLEAQRKTMENAYHIQPFLPEFCDDFENDYDKRKGDSEEFERISKTIMFFNKNVWQSQSELEISEPLNDLQTKCEAETSRWCSLVRSLEMMDDCQEFLGGRVRISCKEKRQSHVISTGGNFTPVELGLGVCNRPLAVKRIPKGSCVCEMIKTMLTELLNLRHKNLLHYFACEYDTNELILATPLCEYNVGQYLMLMKQNQTSLMSVEVVKQFLTGLLFLHGRQEPIVHGNLKPSNIFVDINGVVKIAEFGIHRALFKFKEAPKSSIIWFATETYRSFKQFAIMKCTSASDIQVAGMLVHFLMTAGKHPYGDNMRTILKNLDKAVPQLSANDLELEDLITWMLLYDPSERPNIQQVVTHVYFWSPERKWRFILTCAGLGMKTRNPAFKLDDLHARLEKVASKDNIKGKWVQVVQQQFPKISFANNDDTPTGLLKFIRTCMDSKQALCFNTDQNLSNYILTSFPAFALSLYRMLENSVWVKHSTFSNFYSIDNL